MTRIKLLALWLICASAAPALIIAMLAQVLAGSITRAKSMAIAFDECGNALLGGGSRETISCRAGLAVTAGKRWGMIVAPVIDWFFGAGHCASNAKQNNSDSVDL